MRLSEWREAAPSKDAVAPKVTAVVDPVIAAFGVGDDPDGWIAWGEEPGQRYTILVPTDAGLVTCYVRVNVPGEGPRASAKLIRWNRVQLGELAVETQSGHRLLSFQVEQQVLHGADEVADRIATFALEMFAAVDGRPNIGSGNGGRATTAAAKGAAAKAAAAKGAAAKATRVTAISAKSGAAPRPGPTR